MAGLLPEHEREQFDEHCFSCDSCFSDLMFYEKLVHVIQAEGNILFADYVANKQSKSPGFWTSILDRFSIDFSPQWAYGAVAIAMVIIPVYGEIPRSVAVLITIGAIRTTSAAVGIIVVAEAVMR